MKTMTPQEQFEKALRGAMFESIFLRFNRFKIVAKSPTHFKTEVTAKKVKEETSGFGAVQITAFTKWHEPESIKVIERGFEQGEYLICDEENIREFLKVE